jgi:hypothetical protein
MPDQQLEADWPFPQRLPLGAAWSGSCTAAQDATKPSVQELKSCNLGYARSCDKLPAERHADAVRFSLGEERGGLVRIRFAFEREYLPAGSGELVYEVASGGWQTEQSNPCLQRMAECYLSSQRKRRGGSEESGAAFVEAGTAGQASA